MTFRRGDKVFIRNFLNRDYLEGFVLGSGEKFVHVRFNLALYSDDLARSNPENLYNLDYHEIKPDRLSHIYNGLERAIRKAKNEQV
jgi:hypothetical protein